jgi:AcrR family transcriptional regulator
MHSASLEDLTGRARIRDVALRVIAERGFEGATLRAIAAEAGVSAGLVQHHFGSKDGLRAACDAHVLQVLRREVAQVMDERRVGDPEFIEAAYASGPLLTRYLVRALLDGSPAAASMFDQVVQLTERYMPHDQGADTRAWAAVLAAMKLGVSVFQDHLARVLEVQDLARDGYPRISRAMLDILSPRFVEPEFAAEARAGLDRHERSTSTTRRKRRV